MRAFVVCVDYDDYLSKTLPLNRRHFSDYVVVTSNNDTRTQNVALENGCLVYKTDLFWSKGESFNKWAALEAAFNYYGRHGIICVIDADIVLPEKFSPAVSKNVLYGCRRRIWRDYKGEAIPPSEAWHKFPLHPYIAEIAGYLQLFDSSSGPCQTLPWYDTNWVHAGGADSFFQARWQNKVFLAEQVLHLGQDGVNWCGRVVDRIDTAPISYDKSRLTKLRQLISLRREHGYKHERLSDFQ
ncbi:MAG: hypothetical protein KatS3mg087_1169 [Patescibacteria group bacterium]|nr:MAG: hypothetical protein KatS3mg087_1169 [Patescibacteria group bacterium]